jgi:hypothetical protein
MRSIIKLLLPILIVLQIGCATTYHKGGFMGGYDETQLSENVWKVGFKGNMYTDMTKTQDFLMYRNAELTKEKGFRYFGVKSESSDVETSISSTQGYLDPISNMYSGGTIDTEHRPRSQNTIIMFKEKPQNTYVVYDPEIIINSIKIKYPSDFQGDQGKFNIKQLLAF